MKVARTLADLYSFESNTTVRDIMKNMFFYLDDENPEEMTDEELLHRMAIEDDDMVWSWCEESGMKRKNFIDWVEASLDDIAKFKVTDEFGSSGGWPEAELDLGAGVKFTIIWGNIED